MTTRLHEHPARVSEAEWAEIVDALTRREFLTGGAALGALGLAGWGESGPTASAEETKGWTYTDDIGRTVHLAKRPTRIALLADPVAASLWSVGARLVAALLASGNAPILEAGGVPLHGKLAAVAGPGGNGINLEELAKAAPDLVVTTTVSDKLANFVNYRDVEKIAPVIGLNFYDGSFDTVIGRINRLAQALGADPTDRAAEKQYEAASTRLRTVLAAKPRLRIVWMGVGSTAASAPVWVNNPNSNSQTAPLTITALGAHLYSRKGNPSPYQDLSWEVVPELPADFVILGSYPKAVPPANPAWKLMPAVKAGQYAIFTNQWATITYANYASLLNHLATAIRTAKPDVGPK